jgi:Domain of unknown function (DUF4258)
MVGTVLPFRDPENYSQVLRTIRRLWHEGTVEYRIHAVRQMERQGLTDQDVASVILTGSIIEHNHRGKWRWKVQGGCVDGHNASCVVEIELQGTLLVITVIDERGAERSTP